LSGLREPSPGPNSSIFRMSAGVSDATLDRSRPVWVLCESGFRAAIAASQLVALGYRPVLLAKAGVTDVLGSLSERV
jgi:rhodanese-related sulfurtransferase